MSQEDTYEERRKFIFRRMTRLSSEAKIRVEPTVKTKVKIPVSKEKVEKPKIKLEDTGTIRTNRFLFD